MQIYVVYLRGCITSKDHKLRDPRQEYKQMKVLKDSVLTKQYNNHMHGTTKQ